MGRVSGPFRAGSGHGPLPRRRVIASLDVEVLRDGGGGCQGVPRRVFGAWESRQHDADDPAAQRRANVGCGMER